MEDLAIDLGGRSRVESYARGRDYHYAHRDRMRKLRKALLELDPTIGIYTCVDTGMAMEGVGRARGDGWISVGTDTGKR